MTSVEDAACLGCLSMSNTGKNVDRMEGLVLENRRAIIHEISNMLGILSGLVPSTLKDMYRIAAIFVLMLSEECEFLATKKMHVVPHPPCSPDLVPCDFFLF